MSHKYKRISIVGISSAGKSTFARKLAEQMQLPVYHMDSLFWGPGWREIPAHEWQNMEAAIIKQPEWILEGYIEANYCERLKHSDLIVYLDLPGIVCAINGFKRWWRYRGSARPELQGCIETFDISFLWTMLRRKERSDVEGALRQANVKNLMRLTSGKAIDEFLESLA